MKQVYWLLLFSIFSLVGCEGGYDKDLISNTEKLVSPSREFTLYRYNIASPMAFGSGFTAIQILPSDIECDFTDRDIFRFGNSYPFFMKWKDNKTLTVKCLSSGGPSTKQPFEKKVEKFEDWTFEVEYYAILSSGKGGDFLFDSYSTSGDSVVFKSENGFLAFKKDKVQFTIDSNQVSAVNFILESFNQKHGLSFTHYELSTKTFNQKDLLKEQVFIKSKL